MSAKVGFTSAFLCNVAASANLAQFVAKLDANFHTQALASIIGIILPDAMTSLQCEQHDSGHNAQDLLNGLATLAHEAAANKAQTRS